MYIYKKKQGSYNNKPIVPLRRNKQRFNKLKFSTPVQLDQDFSENIARSHQAHTDDYTSLTDYCWVKTKKIKKRFSRMNKIMNFSFFPV